MNKLIRLSPTGIEYGDYAWNFASGCGNNVEGRCRAGGFKCWAYSISQRFEGHYPNGFKPTVYPDALLSPLYLKKPSRILCVFMGDLFWDCSEFDPWREIVLRDKDGRVFFEGSLRDRIMMTIGQCPHHTFLFLTKQPQNLVKFSPFPDNVYLGVTVCNQGMFDKAVYYLKMVDAKIKFLSMEPLLEAIDITFSTGYNTEYESEIQRNHSLQDGSDGGIRDRHRRESVESESPEVRQVERWEQDIALQETQGRKRHGQIPSSEDNDKRETLPRIGSQISMVSLQRDDTVRTNNQSQRWECEGQSTREYGINDIQPEHQALHKNIGEDVQAGQVRSISWLILGAQTKPSVYPKIEWVEEIVVAADKAGIPVFLKQNLRPLFKGIKEPAWAVGWENKPDELRQELPQGGG